MNTLGRASARPFFRQPRGNLARKYMMYFVHEMADLLIFYKHYGSDSLQ